jgi:phosphoglycolate phosphatase-like HAD superfamily hydrolase
MQEKKKTWIRFRPGQEIFFGWDVDGVVYNSAYESYVNTIESLRRNKAEIQGAGLRVPKEPDYPFFNDIIRPRIISVEDFFALPLLMESQGVKRVQDIKGGKKALKSFMKQHEELIQKLTKGYYDVRKENQEKDINSWRSMFPLYGGIKEVMEFLKQKGIKQVVISTKDRNSIEELLTHHGIRGYIEQILAREEAIPPGGKVPTQAYSFSSLKGKYPGAKHIFIDDSPEALREVKGKHPDVKLISALWGYGFPGAHRKVKGTKLPKNASELLELLKGIFGP